MVVRITTDYGSEIVCWVFKLRMKLNFTAKCSINFIEHSYVRYIAHVLNNAFNDCLCLVRKRVEKVRSVTSSLRWPAKRWDLFLKLNMELSSIFLIPSLDANTRRSSTFLMVCQALNICRVVNAMKVREKDPNIEAVSEAKCSTCDVHCKFLRSAAEIT